MYRFLCNFAGCTTGAEKDGPLTQKRMDHWRRKVFALKTSGKIFLSGEDVFGRRFATRSKATGKEGELLSQNAKEF